MTLEQTGTDTTAPIHTRGLVDIPPDRTEVTRLVLRGDIRHVTSTEAADPLDRGGMRWHRFDQPDGVTVFVLTRRKGMLDGEIILDHDGNQIDPVTGGGGFIYRGALTVVEAQGAHAAWCAWRSAEQTATGAKATTQQRADAQRLRGLYEGIMTQLQQRYRPDGQEGGEPDVSSE